MSKPSLQLSSAELSFILIKSLSKWRISFSTPQQTDGYLYHPVLQRLYVRALNDWILPRWMPNNDEVVSWIISSVRKCFMCKEGEAATGESQGKDWLPQSRCSWFWVREVAFPLCSSKSLCAHSGTLSLILNPSQCNRADQGWKTRIDWKTRLWRQWVPSIKARETPYSTLWCEIP